MPSNIDKLLSPIKFSTFEIIKDDFLGGFKVNLVWESKPGAIFYKIYKSNLPENITSKEYKINQKTLEILSPASTISKGNNNILYNRNIIQNVNNVKSEYGFFPIAQISNNKKTLIYNFFDKNVKFQNGYSYILTFVNSFLQESPFGYPLTLAIEDLEPPAKPTSVILNDSSSGVTVTAINKDDQRICYFKIFRKNNDLKEQFKEIETIPSNKGVEIFLDKNVIAGNEYEYKIFSVDYFNVLSLDSTHATCGYNPFFMNDATVPYPEVEIINDSESLLFKCKKNHDNLIGVKIERKDIWKYDLTFETKAYSANIWPNIILFNEEGVAEFKDNFLIKDKKYQYRISNVLKNQRLGSCVFSPIIVLKDLEKKINLNKEEIKSEFKLKNFNFEIVNKDQNPVYVKCNFDIIGSWDFLKLNYDDKELIIDSVNEDFILSFVEKKKYLINFSFMKNDKEIFSMKNIILNIN